MMQMTEVLRVDVMTNLRKIVLEMCAGHEGVPSKAPRDGQGDPDEGRRSAAIGSDRRENNVEPITYGQQTVHIVVGAFGVTSEICPPDQAKPNKIPQRRICYSKIHGCS